jgi:hypothetical protein
MNSSIDQLAKFILQKNSLEQCTLSELKQLTDRFPYFSPAQFLFAKKLSVESGENNEAYDHQLQKTSLFFHNPLRLQYLLNDDTGNAEIILSDASDFPSTTIETEIIPGKKEEQTGAPATITESTVLAGEQQSGPIIEQSEEKSDEVKDSIQEPPPPVELPSFKIEPPDSGNDPAKTELIFEPYHTVDYFASQGIKFKEEEKPKDKFGQQLKSFTEWLKTLKRLPATETIQPVDVNAEEKVEQLADQSLQEREVVTETMAEVWEKQGNAIKAIGIYNKLSLLDPSKKAYFATKIEELKKTT